MKPTLLVLAAGMGSRYGGLKQLDGLGPHGETIMDYSIYDAMRSGFGKVVFVIRKDFEEQFRDKVLSRYEGMIPAEVVFQERDDLPEGYTAPADRVRPWGTNHAVMMGRSVIAEPFAVINSDDFYGRDAFRVLAAFLSEIPQGEKGRYSMVAFNVGNTTTKNGEVSRGVCAVNPNGKLKTVVERHHIVPVDEKTVSFTDENGEKHHISSQTPVSMNFWGFTPDYFELSEREFRRFLDKFIADPKREFFIPSVVDKLIGNGEASVQVLPTESHWFGVTFSEDREGVRKKLDYLHSRGLYPDNLFEAKKL